MESQPTKLVGGIGSKNRYFDFDKLAEAMAIVTKNLNKIIDVNYYPVETAKRSNMRHRPIWIGVQGLADTFMLLGMAFDSLEAQQLNRDIFETIYYHALKASCELAEEKGSYETYNGSPVSKGILQHDMWGVMPSDSCLLVCVKFQPPDVCHCCCHHHCCRRSCSRLLVYVKFQPPDVCHCCCHRHWCRWGCKQSP